MPQKRRRTKRPLKEIKIKNLEAGIERKIRKIEEIHYNRDPSLATKMIVIKTLSKGETLT